MLGAVRNLRLSMFARYVNLLLMEGMCVVSGPVL